MVVGTDWPMLDERQTDDSFCLPEFNRDGNILFITTVRIIFDRLNHKGMKALIIILFVFVSL
jgi:hypothetical protein